MVLFGTNDGLHFLNILSQIYAGINWSFLGNAVNIV